MKFQDYNIKSEIKRALIDDMGIHTPTEIQEKAIPKLIKHNRTHVLAQAKTGTGKTLAFSIPIAEKIDPKLKKVQALVLTPTRELCKQVHDVMADLTKHLKIRTIEVYGGVSINRQMNAIRKGAQIVVATPGRLIDIYRRGEISFKHTSFVVLDEADRMLDMGFLPDAEFILFKAMENVYPQLLLFSATMLTEIKEIAQDFSFGQELMEIDVSHDDLTVQNCEQFYVFIDNPKKKFSKFVQIMQLQKPKSSIIFVNTKRWAATLKRLLIRDKRLKKLKLRFDTLQGDMTQRQREIVMREFRKGKINCLIATDVAARGLDIRHVTHVFNYDLPEGKPEIYVHRVGRTSRMKEAGKAIALVEHDEMNMVRRIESFMNRDIKRLYLSKQERESDSRRRTYRAPKRGRPAKGNSTDEESDELEFEEEFPETVADVSMY